MKCPNCEQEMTDKSYRYYRFGDFDPVILYEEYICEKCGIEYDGNKWKIPSKYAPATYKQVKAIDFINSQLGTSEQPILKNQCWVFIHNNLQKAIDTYKESISTKSDYDDDDWEVPFEDWH